MAQGVDGEQQCMYVTAAVDESQTVAQTENSVLTLDGAVAEAVDGTTEQTQIQPLTVDTSELGVEQAEEGDPNSQVVAQLLRAELPSPGEDGLRGGEFSRRTDVLSLQAVRERSCCSSPTATF